MSGRRFNIVVALAFAAGVLIAPVSASAEPPYIPDPHTSAVVSLLSLTRSSGVLVLKVQIGQDEVVSSVDAGVAAFGGRWAVSPAVDFSAQGVRCISRTSVAGSFRYICRRLDHGYLPEGKYSFALPVHRVSGKRDGMTGSVYLTRSVGSVYPSRSVGATELVYRDFSDTFPVVDSATQPGSSAEIRSIDLHLVDGDPGLVWAAKAYLVLNVTDGDRIADVTFTLPAALAATWLVRSGFAANNVWCAATTAAASDSAVVISCQMLGVSLLPTGTYQLEIPLRLVGPGSDRLIGTVFVSRPRDQSTTMDTYPIHLDYEG